MRVLCTGAAGYIGSIVVARLLSEGHEVIALDNLSRGHRNAVPPTARFVEVDVVDLGKLLPLFEESVDAVVHLAALASVEESQREPSLYHSNNSVGTMSLAQAISTSRCPRIVFASSCSVYGYTHLAIEDETLLVPTSAYAESKAHSEKILLSLQRNHGTAVGVLRLFNVGGAARGSFLGERHDPETHLIPRILQSVLRNESFVINGQDYQTPDGTCVRDYVHVEDVVDAISTVLSHLEPSDYRVYNVGTGIGTSVREMVEIVQRVTGRMVYTVLSDRRSGDPDYVLASTTKIMTELGWSPKWSVFDMVDSAWSFMQRRGG